MARGKKVEPKPQIRREESTVVSSEVKLFLPDYALTVRDKDPFRILVGKMDHEEMSQDNLGVSIAVPCGEGIRFENVEELRALAQEMLRAANRLDEAQGIKK